LNDLVIALFDVVSYLNDKGMPFVTEGKDVTSGWIGLSCLWCSDSSNHLGVNLSSGLISCWRCGVKGSVVKLVKEIEQSFSFPETLAVMEKYQDFSRLSKVQDIEEHHYKLKIEIPTFFVKMDWPYVPQVLQKFLFHRGFDPETVCRSKSLFYGGIAGKFKHRLILPVTLKGKLVSWVGRDLTGKSTIPYLNLEDEKSVLPVKSTLYGYDEAPPGGNVVVVEGILDQWKLGSGAVATYGTQWTQTQVKLLRGLNPNKIFIIFDSEDMAQESAVKLSKQIWWCVSEVMSLNNVNDPGDLSVEEGKKLMYMLSAE
jgi:DNA primase